MVVVVVVVAVVFVVVAVGVVAGVVVTVVVVVGVYARRERVPVCVHRVCVSAAQLAHCCCVCGCCCCDGGCEVAALNNETQQTHTLCLSLPPICVVAHLLPMSS